MFSIAHMAACGLPTLGFQVLRDAFPFVSADVTVNKHPVQWEPNDSDEVYTVPLSLPRAKKLYATQLCHVPTVGLLQDTGGGFHVVYPARYHPAISGEHAAVGNAATRRTWRQLVQPPAPSCDEEDESKGNPASSCAVAGGVGVGVGMQPVPRFLYDLSVQLPQHALPFATMFFRGASLRAPCVPPTQSLHAGAEVQWADMDMLALQQRFQDTVSPPWERTAAACRSRGIVRVVIAVAASFSAASFSAAPSAACGIHASWGDLFVPVNAAGAVLVNLQALADRMADRPLLPVRVICLAKSAAEFDACAKALPTVLTTVPRERPFAADVTVVIVSPASVAHTGKLHDTMTTLFDLASSRRCRDTAEFLCPPNSGSVVMSTETSRSTDGSLHGLLRAFQVVLFRRHHHDAMLGMLQDGVSPGASFSFVGPAVPATPAVGVADAGLMLRMFLRGTAPPATAQIHALPQRTIVPQLAECMFRSIIKGQCKLVQLHQLFGLSGASTVLSQAVLMLRHRKVEVVQLALEDVQDCQSGSFLEAVQWAKSRGDRFVVVVDGSHGHTRAEFAKGCRLLQATVANQIRGGMAGGVVAFCATIQPTEAWPVGSHLLPFGLDKAEYDSIKASWVKYGAGDEGDMPPFHNPFPMWLFPLRFHDHFTGANHDDMLAAHRSMQARVVPVMRHLWKHAVPTGPTGEAVRAQLGATLNAMCAHVLFGTGLGNQAVVVAVPVHRSLQRLAPFVVTASDDGQWRLAHPAYAMLLLEALHGRGGGSSDGSPDGVWGFAEAVGAWRLQSARVAQQVIEDWLFSLSWNKLAAALAMAGSEEPNRSTLPLWLQSCVADLDSAEVALVVLANLRSEHCVAHVSASMRAQVHILESKVHLWRAYTHGAHTTRHARLAIAAAEDAMRVAQMLGLGVNPARDNFVNVVASRAWRVDDDASKALMQEQLPAAVRAVSDALLSSDDTDSQLRNVATLHKLSIKCSTDNHSLHALLLQQCGQVITEYPRQTHPFLKAILGCATQVSGEKWQQHKAYCDKLAQGSKLTDGHRATVKAAAEFGATEEARREDVSNKVQPAGRNTSVWRALDDMSRKRLRGDIKSLLHQGPASVAAGAVVAVHAAASEGAGVGVGARSSSSP